MINSRPKKDTVVSQTATLVSNKKRIIIHTGPGKTGTSAIQAWLVNNRKYLSQYRVFYPEHRLGKSQISSGNIGSILSQIDKKDKINSVSGWYVDYEKIDNLLKEFYSSSAEILLLSSEFFFHRIVDIHKAIPEAEFIAYVRNPVELLESNYNQGIKRHGFIEKFKAPKFLDKYFWQYLTGVFEKVNAKKIFLRPYDERLMVDGNIVSDLLKVVGIDLIVEDKRVNSSYTLASLEFKRLLNSFSLGSLELKVDSALQGCKVGFANYSLMDQASFKRLNKQSCHSMQIFIDKYKQVHLISLLKLFQNAEQKPFRQQEVSFDDLSAICEYMYKKNRLVFKQLKALISLHNNLLIDNSALYSLFNVKFSPEYLLNDKDKKLLKHFDYFTIREEKHEIVACELSRYFSLKDDWVNAVLFAKIAFSKNPKNKKFQQQLNRVLIKTNKYSCKKSIFESAISCENQMIKITKNTIENFTKSFLSLLKRKNL